MAARQARIAFWIGVTMAVLFLILVVAITFSSGGGEYSGGSGH